MILESILLDPDLPILSNGVNVGGSYRLDIEVFYKNTALVNLWGLLPSKSMDEGEREKVKMTIIMIKT